LASGVELDTVNHPSTHYYSVPIAQLLSGMELERVMEFDDRDMIPFEVYEEDRRQYLPPA
jgi:hypothetical protein